MRVAPWSALALLLLPAELLGAPDFGSYWYDGKAELSGYALTQSRYGSPRSGSVALIFVTEPFSDTARVKADPGRHPQSDVFNVVKLNVAKRFQTGIYPYHLFTSVFAQTEPRTGRHLGAPVKAVFSSQEWCGAMFDELIFRSGHIDARTLSYFDGEGGPDKKLEYPKEGLAVDELPIFVRGLFGPALEPGEQIARPMLPSMEQTRLLHRPQAWTSGTVKRGAGTETITVPAGRFVVERWSAKLENGDEYVYLVESEHPRRLVSWLGPSGEEAKLLGSERLVYWQLNGPGGEKALERLGLKPLP